MIVVLFCMAALAACTPEPGDHLVAKRDMNVVINWNEPSILKDTCFITEGTEVEVLDVSILLLGSTDQETIIQVRDLEHTCTGWGFPENFGEK